ncbi:MAG TPA: magnesium transporter [Usitatibacter sp.]|nr:magnesium transporter [Usitatibacter sp.]
MTDIAEAPAQVRSRERPTLAAQIRTLPANEAAALIERTPPAEAVQALQEINPGMAASILRELESAPRRFLTASAPPEIAEQWRRNTRFARGTIGQMMEPPLSVFEAAMSVGDAIDALRPLVRTALVTYVYVVDAENRLLGLVTMRDLLFNDRAKTLDEVMLRDPFTLSPELKVQEAMKLTVNRHFPQYPVCDAGHQLVGVVRGAALFELEAFEITAQAGSMVGVEKEERISTPIGQSFRFRNPWLLANLVTAFAAGGVVAFFQGTLDRLVILATFLPVLAGQCGNTGCQALAVTVRGITLGEIGPGTGRALVTKEMLLGLANGAVTGVLCGIAMYFYAISQGATNALMLGVVVNAAMIGSCALSGVSGALVPLALKKLGADPATASSIVVTTATDVSSMGLLLALATYLVK